LRPGQVGSAQTRRRLQEEYAFACRVIFRADTYRKPLAGNKAAAAWNRFFNLQSVLLRFMELPDPVFTDLHIYWNSILVYCVNAWSCW
jgi:hypothetical protein